MKVHGTTVKIPDCVEPTVYWTRATGQRVVRLEKKKLKRKQGPSKICRRVTG